MLEAKSLIHPSFGCHPPSFIMVMELSHVSIQHRHDEKTYASRMTLVLKGSEIDYIVHGVLCHICNGCFLSYFEVYARI